MSQKPKQGYSLNYITDTLTHALKPVWFTTLYEASMIKNKATFLKYINWCIKKNFMTKKTIMTSEYKHRGRFSNNIQHIKARQIPRTQYQITTTGYVLLGMIK